MKHRWLRRLSSAVILGLASIVMMGAARAEEAPALFLLDRELKPVEAPYGEGLAIVHFWATWCAPCVEELPHLEAFARAHPEVSIYPVSLDGRNVGKIREFYEKRGIATLPVLLDDGMKTFRAFNGGVLPASVFIRGGKVVKRVEGMVEWGRVELGN